MGWTDLSTILGGGIGGWDPGPGESLGAWEEGLQAGSPGGSEGLEAGSSEAGSPPGGGIAGWESASWSLGLRILEGFGGRSDSGESRESWEEGLRDGILGGELGGLES